MSANWKRLLNKAFGVTAKDIDISQTCPVRRKRLLWTNISGISMSPSKPVDSKSCLDKGWTTAHDIGILPANKFHRWDCFLRAHGPGSPPELPLDFYTLSPHAYTASNLTFKADTPPEILAAIKSRLHEAQALGDYQFTPKAREPLIRWIHQEGGLQYLRPLHGLERARALSYPVNLLVDTSSHVPFSENDWTLISAMGNCFPLPSIVDALRPIATALKQNSRPTLSPSTLADSNWNDVFTRLGLEVPPPPPGTGGERRR